jgi:hypothetical protein
MQPHQQRVVDEKTELDSKLEKLNVFIGSLTHFGLPELEQYRLARQAEAMSQYSRILSERIAAF